MYEALRRVTLALLKAPAEPRPPAGDPASLRVFRAGINYFRLRIAGWAIAEILALGGLIFWTAFLIDVDRSVRTQTIPPKAKEGWAAFRYFAVTLASKLPSGAFALIWALKILAILFYLAQLPITYALRRLDYEMRWYMVTDRSLRLRHGVWQIAESTMSFANIQQVVVSQGPLQRLLGLADVKVKSAGGGDTSGSHGHHEGSDMHSGLFHSVTNANEIRDLILERLRRFREAGLGDPDDKAQLSVPASAASNAVAAASELAAEARALRKALQTMR